MRMRITLAIPPLLFAGLTFWQVVLGHPVGKQSLSNASLIAFTILLALVYLRLITVRLSTEVTEAGVRVWMRGFFRERRFAASDVKSVKVITYDPIRDFGGYGIRKTRRGMVMLATGSRGVRLELVTGTRAVIGSARADELASAINRARQSRLSR